MKGKMKEHNDQSVDLGRFPVLFASICSKPLGVPNHRESIAKIRR